MKEYAVKKKIIITIKQKIVKIKPNCIIKNVQVITFLHTFLTNIILIQYLKKYTWPHSFDNNIDYCTLIKIVF